MIDPWGGFSDSLKDLNGTLSAIPGKDMQRALARQQLAMGNLRLQAAQREEQDTTDRRALLAGLQPTTKTVMVDQMGPSVPVTNPATPADHAALAAKIQSMKAQQYDPSKSFGDQDTLGATIPQAAYDAQQAQIAPLQAQLDQPSQVEGAPLPQVAQQQTVPVTHEQMVQALTEHAIKTGNYDEVTKAINVEGMLAKRKAELEQTGGDMTAYVKAQTDLAGSKDLMATITPLLAKGQAGRQLAVAYLQAYKAAHPGNQVIQATSLSDFGTDGDSMVQAVRDPQTGQILGHYIMNPSKGEMEFKQSNAAEAANTDFGTFKLGYKQEYPQATDADVSRAWQKNQVERETAKRQVIVSNPMPPKMSMGMNELSPAEKAALATAISEKRLDPYKVNSKNQQLLAAAALQTPGIDLNAIAAQLGVARNKDVVMKAGTAEMLPSLIQKTAEAGKALNYSDAKFIGSIERWKSGQLNDPKLTRYMTLRNDQLLTIGSVVRGNGMTDMAQRLEEEAMHPTLSPRALDQWVEGQLESIDPRLNFYRQLTKGNQGIPRSNYQPGTGAKGLDARPQAPITTKGGFKVTVVQ